MTQPPSPCRTRLGWLAWFLLALAGPLFLYLNWNWLTTTRPGGVRVAFDGYDLGIYHTTSRWAVGDGTLYRDVFSEYPLAANLIFAAVRLVADHLDPFPSSLDSFCWVWTSAAWMVFVAVLRRVALELPWPALLLWLNPAVLYFTLLRFDVYPAALTLFCLLAARRNRPLTAAGWLGLAVAVKGYALVLVPAFVVFVWRVAGVRKALVAGAICVGPFALGNAVVYAYAGLDGMAGPYRFHAQRKLDSESSTYDTAADVFGQAGAKRIVEYPRVATALQLAGALLAAGLLALPRRDPFAGLVNAGLVALTALTSFSLFYSPQFVLWIVPLAACSDSRLLRVVVHVCLVGTLAYFPVAFDLRVASGYAEPEKGFFVLAVLVVTLSRLAVTALALWRLIRSRAVD